MNQLERDAAKQELQDTAEMHRERADYSRMNEAISWSIFMISVLFVSFCEARVAGEWKDPVRIPYGLPFIPMYFALRFRSREKREDEQESDCREEIRRRIWDNANSQDLSARRLRSTPRRSKSTESASLRH